MSPIAQPGLPAAHTSAGIAGASANAAGFSRTFLLTSYGLVTVAFFAVASSGQIGLVAPAAFAIALVASLLVPQSPTPQPERARLWTAALVATLLALIAWSIQDDNWLLHSLEFALAMTASRLFQRRYAKDWLQLYALSFLLVLVAAVIHPTMLFAISFVLYGVLAIWALTMLHIVRQIEIATHTTPEEVEPETHGPDRRRWWQLRARPVVARTPLPDGPITAETLQWRSRKLVGRGFLLGSSLMAIGALAASMLFFLMFPRIGMGFFFARTRAGQSVTGFADEVKLGGFGRIKSSAEVVMRVSFPEEPDRLDESLRIRGLSFDTFDGRNWSRSDEQAWTARRTGQRFDIRTWELPDDDARTWQAQIYLEPLQTENSVLFAPVGTHAVEWLDSQFDSLRGRRKRVEVTTSGDLRYVASKDLALSYLVTVREPRSESVRRKRLAAAEGPTPPALLERYTQLPETLDPRIAALARTLMVGDTPLERILALESRLRRDWTYSLAGDQNNDAPLEDFLFGRKSGHCEYFATAMTVMLRTQGVPARVVNGFLGGERNDFGDYRMIKQGDAHSWVEVWFPEAGWQSFDPTPAAGQLAPLAEGIAAAMRRFADGAAMLWYSWVVEYDLERQVGLLRDIGQLFKSMSGGLQLPGRSSSGLRQIHDESEPDAAQVEGQGLPPWWPVPLALVVVIAGLLVLRQRRLADRDTFDVAIARQVRRLDAALLLLDLQHTPHDTWHALARMAGIAGHDGVATALGGFAQAWDQARWRDPSDDEARATALRAAVQATEVARDHAKALQERHRLRPGDGPATLGATGAADAAAPGRS